MAKAEGLMEFISETVEENGAERSRLTAVLHEVQKRYNYLPEQALRRVAELMDIPLIDVYGVATFFTSFSLEPKGVHIVTVCMGTACHVRNSEGLLTEISRYLGIKAGETTADMLFTLETVNCVGACAMGPVMVVDGKYHGGMNASMVAKVMQKYERAEAEKRTDWKLTSPAALDDYRKMVVSARPTSTGIFLCSGTGCCATGSDDLYEALVGSARRAGLDGELTIGRTGCRGFCERGPILTVKPDNTFYQKVSAEDADEVVRATAAGEIVDRLLYVDQVTGERLTRQEEIPFYAKQNRLLLGANEELDPADMECYIAAGGYSAMTKALFEMEPEDIISEVEKAGLRGRGGGGFPTARKWIECRRANSPDGVKYVLCNADEGDPGAFMDRSLLEGNPHCVLEGMIIGAKAIGASNGYVYVRNEYPLAVANVTKAIEKARSMGLLGEDILGSGFSFDVGVSRGGGAFVCGESTALMASIEGRVGEPREKYIHTAIKGLNVRPTNLNNVETWANVPIVINGGSEKYASIGTENSKGTKIFSLVGKISNTGLVEVPMGMTLREIIFDIGGGVPNGKAFKAVQTGGPSGGCIPEDLLDTPVDFDRLTDVGSMMGSGGMIVMDEDTCMVDVARYFLEFLCDESCGKCTPCREGLKHMMLILDDISKGEGSLKQLELLEELAEVVSDTSLCGLGQTAPNPVLSTIRYFNDEYREHIEQGKCRAGVCKSLVTYAIDEATCNGCTLCARRCPTSAITGEKKEPHKIDISLCEKCGICYEVCESDAVRRV